MKALKIDDNIPERILHAMRSVAIVTARGGSKRLPGKNVMELGGKPLIAHSIDYALRFLPGERVFVTTDSEEIAAVAVRYGAQVIRRPKALADDHATSGAVMQHAAQWLVDNGCDFDYAVLLQPTNPLRPASLWDDVMSTIRRTGCESLFSVSRMVRKLGRLNDGKFVPANYVPGQRSQDIEPLYYENGLIYATHRRLLLEGVIYDQDSVPLLVEGIYGEVDIDERSDFLLAEALYPLLTR